MQNFGRNNRPITANQPNIKEAIKKYKRLIWQKKYSVLFITLIVSIVWFIVYSLFLTKQMEYTASTTIKFDDPRRRTSIGITDFAEFGSEGKVAILYTNSFLSKVVDSLHLNVELKKPMINRFSLFKNINPGINASFGTYRVLVSEKEVNAYYSNEKEGIEEKKLYSGGFPSNSSLDLSLNNLNISLDFNILSQIKELEFAYRPRLKVVSNLKKKLEGNLDRSRTILTIYFTYNHPEASAFITNTIANMFISNLLEHKKYRTSSVLKSLEDQLRAANQSLNQSEEILREYRERNPYLLLSNGGTSIVTEISGKKSELNLTSEKINRLSNLLQQKTETDMENKGLVYLELISLWETENVSSDHIVTGQYSTLFDERSRLLSDNYSPDHPRILEINEKLNNFQNEFDARVNEYLKQLKSKQKRLQSDIYSGRRNLRRLPKGEMELAELQQDRDVKSQIYSNILVRYNEAKIADASIIADAFVIDWAEEPIIEAKLLDTILNISIGPILGFLIAIGFIFFLDHIDDSIKRSDEIESKLHIPVIANIPVILDEKEIPDNINMKSQLDYKLITSDYSPSIAGEKFRLLRTKLLIDKDKTKKFFIITSLSPSDGKSLIAANLAITFAQQKISSLLIDSDMRRGVLHNSFNCSKKPGLSDLLASNRAINKDELLKSIQQTHIPYLYLMPSGLQIPNPSELLGGDRMKKLLTSLADEYKVVIFDTPPLEYIPDALVLNSMIHNLIFVVRYGKTRLNKLSEKIMEISNIKEDLQGFIINASQEISENEKYSYSYYHY